jgi:Dynein light chain type 1
MADEMQQESIDVASAALGEKYTIQKDIAAQIKKEFDKHQRRRRTELWELRDVW